MAKKVDLVPLIRDLASDKPGVAVAAQSALLVLFSAKPRKKPRRRASR